MLFVHGKHYFLTSLFCSFEMPGRLYYEVFIQVVSHQVAAYCNLGGYGGHYRVYLVERCYRHHYFLFMGGCVCSGSRGFDIASVWWQMSTHYLGEKILFIYRGQF